MKPLLISTILAPLNNSWSLVAVNRLHQDPFNHCNWPHNPMCPLYEHTLLQTQVPLPIFNLPPAVSSSLQLMLMEAKENVSGKNSSGLKPVWRLAFPKCNLFWTKCIKQIMHVFHRKDWSSFDVKWGYGFFTLLPGHLTFLFLSYYYILPRMQKPEQSHSLFEFVCSLFVFCSCFYITFILKCPSLNILWSSQTVSLLHSNICFCADTLIQSD